MDKFKSIQPEELAQNPFILIGKDWMLVTAGNSGRYNTMTASWGGVGVLWNKPVATIYIRPQRYTYEFVEQNEYFTLSFFDEKYRDALRLCGSKSGRDLDKAKETGLTPVFDGNAVCFEQAKLVIVCKKLYFKDLDPANFLDDGIEKNYPNKDYHRMYIGEIVKVLKA